MTEKLNPTPQGEHEPKPEALPPVVAFKRELYFFLQNMVWFIPILIIAFTFIGRIIPVSGPSMIPTLQDGDMMLLQHMFYEPKQGDVVVLSKDGFHDGVAIVKRVIAVGGQTVKIDYDTNTVYVDGVALDEPYIKEAMVANWASWTTEAVVPEGCIFVMGDNRNVSDDSRDPALGIVDVRRVIGHSLCVFFPFSDFGSI
jgi:signal peptidase I